MGFKLTLEEKDTGKIDEKKLAEIVDAIRTIGFAVVEDVISRETCDLLSRSVREDAHKVLATGKRTSHEEATAPGHLQLGLRRYAPFVTEDLIANPFIECVVAGVLGEGAWLGFYNGNINCPGSGYQPLHFDRPFSWKTPEEAAADDQTWPPPTTTLSCSIALEDITTANGATEVYPGSHLETEVATWQTNRLEQQPELVAKYKPARMEIPARGVCFRDPRMWHRGVPNTSVRVRAMIAATYHAARCKNWQGRYIQDIEPMVANQLAEDPALRILEDGSLGDGRLVFDYDTHEVFEGARSLHGVIRNARFVAPPQRVNHFVDAHALGGARVIRDAEPAPETA